MATLPNGKVRIQLELGPDDADLIEALSKSRSRARGARLKFLAKLGLLAEKGRFGGGGGSMGAGKRGARLLASPEETPAPTPSPAPEAAAAPPEDSTPAGVMDLLAGFGLELPDQDQQ